VQRAQPSAAGDQHQAAGHARQQQADLLVSGRVIEQQKDLLARHVVPPSRRPGLCAGRDLRRVYPGGQQQAGQRVGGPDRPLVWRVGVQWQEELPVGEACGQLAGGSLGGTRDPVGLLWAARVVIIRASYHCGTSRRPGRSARHRLTARLPARRPQ